MIRIAEILKKSARRENDRKGRAQGQEISEDTIVRQQGPLQRADGPSEEQRDDHRTLLELWEFYQKRHPG